MTGKYNPLISTPRTGLLVEESQSNADRRRSNVVKEVERLKENREKRRAQQAQILEEKEAQRNIDPGNNST